MANLDDAADAESSCVPDAGTSIRRSTFTPPTTSDPGQPERADAASEQREYDDDDLADALAEEAVRLGYSGPIQTVEWEPNPNRDVLAHLPPPSGPPVELPGHPLTASASYDVGADIAVTRPEPEAADDNASAAVHPNPTLPNPPERRSVPDDDLVRSLSQESLQPDGISNVFDKFQEQLRLREQEAREFQEWEDTVQAIGTTEALRLIEKVKTGLIEVIPAVPQAGDEGYEPLGDEPLGDEPPGDEPPVDAIAQGMGIAPPVAPSLSSRFAPQPGVADFDALMRGAVDTHSYAPGSASAGSEQLVVVDDPPARQPIFALETTGLESTPLESRVGGTTRLFWLWFATNSSVLSVAFGAALLSLGMSLRQAIVSALLGVAISFLPLGLGTLAGKRSGQPTMVVSRASFGLIGNVVPAVLAVIVRLFWGSVLLWMIAVSTARVLVGAKLAGPSSETQLTMLVVVVGFGIALAVAYLGYHLFARLQLVLAVLSGILLLGVVAATWSSVNIPNALTVRDGPWILVVTGLVLVFSFIGLAWATSSGDVARYQRPTSSGASSMLWASFGATVPPFALIAYGALLAASDPGLARGFMASPLDTLRQLLPGWFAVPLIAAVVLSLLSGVILSIYSGGFSLQSAGVRLPRAWATVLVGMVVLAVAIVMIFTVNDVVPLFRDLATTLAVPVAAWVGIVASEIMIRRRRLDSPSLLKRGGVYPSVNWLNLSMLVVASVVGFGLTTATVSWLGWQGYLFTAFGLPSTTELAGTDLGVLVALLLGLLTPLVAGVPAVRRQEQERS